MFVHDKEKNKVLNTLLRCFEFMLFISLSFIIIYSMALTFIDSYHLLCVPMALILYCSFLFNFKSLLKYYKKFDENKDGEKNER